MPELEKLVTQFSRLGIRFGGLGGQGVILAGYLLGDAAIRQGLEAIQTQTYGAEARGSRTHADVVLSKGPVHYPAVDKFDVLVVMAQDPYEFNYKRLKRSGLLITDADLVTPRENRHDHVAAVPATQLAVDELDLKVVANVVLLGYLGRRLGFFDREALVAAVRENAPPKFVAKNLQALAMGWEHE